MVKRLFDIILSTIAIIILFPLFIGAAIGIRLSSPGPILFKTKRVGYKGKIFTLYKFRTMHINQEFHSRITAKNDPRIFKFGSWLRTSKIDELPQLFNILKGDMSIIGPRPEDPEIVQNYYRPEYLETLNVKPGLASPGSIYNYTHWEKIVGNSDPEYAYINYFLPIKIALELVYVRNQSLIYDLKIIWRTILVILNKIIFKKTEFPEPPEMKKAQEILYSWRYNLKTVKI